MPKTISPTELQAAADAIRAGKLVVFPTETVYGLGANALDPTAVARIFEAKGRPRTSPLIVHIENLEGALDLAADWPEHAQALVERFWPGPLTIVVAKRPIIPDIVTASLPSVGLRVPDHEIALALIREAGVPIAAPSANRFSGLSPTRAMHVHGLKADDLLVLDGGPAQVGIESTVVSVDGSAVRILRPGMVSREQIENVVGPVIDQIESTAGPHPSPGMHPRHYQPRTRLLLIDDRASLPPGRGAILSFTDAIHDDVNIVKMPFDPQLYAQSLFDILHRLDTDGLDWIAVETPPAISAWDAIRDRLHRAAHR